MVNITLNLTHEEANDLHTFLVEKLDITDKALKWETTVTKLLNELEDYV